MPIIRDSNLDPHLQFQVFDDEKLRMSLVALADTFSEKVRRIIYRTYTDQKIQSIYAGLRNSGDFDAGGKSKVHREIVRFPNGYVYDFCDTVLTQLYGPDWLQNHRALKHDLVRPWWIITKY